MTQYRNTTRNNPVYRYGLALAIAVSLILGNALPVYAKAVPLSGKRQLESQQENYTPIQQRYEKGLLFRITRPGIPTSYILGTMHSDDPEIKEVYQDALYTIQQVDTVVFEFVENERTSAVAQRYLFANPANGTPISAVLNGAQYQRFAKEIETSLGMPAEVANWLKPWAASIMLQYPAPKSDGIALDQRLQIQAQALGKTLLGLETPEEQYDVFARIPESQQVEMLRDTINQLDEMEEVNDSFMTAYIARDLKKLHVLADNSFDLMSNPKLRQYLKDYLLHKRNHLMAKRMEHHLKKGNVMVAVGALHLMGDTGILAQLEKQGYHIDVGY